MGLHRCARMRQPQDLLASPNHVAALESLCFAAGVDVALAFLPCFLRPFLDLRLCFLRFFLLDEELLESDDDSDSDPDSELSLSWGCCVLL
jgi:hypothetical protein